MSANDKDVTGHKPQAAGHKSQVASRKAVIWEWIESIVVALVLALLIRQFIIQPFKIPTGSMRMTLMEGDRILVNKFIYGAKIPFTAIRLPGLRPPKRGDVIVFVSPQDPKKDFIKRLIALPGETVEIRDGNIYINGMVCKDQFIYNRNYYNKPESAFGSEGQIVNVPRDSYYVLGDNSASSLDSRYWGFVPRKNILGKAIVIFWPLWPNNRVRILQ